MARPRADKTPARRPVKKKFTDAYIGSIKPDPHRVVIAYDTLQIGFCITTQSSGSKAYKALYYANKRPRWYHLGRVNEISLSDARRAAAGVMLEARAGKDPAAEKRAERSRGSFAELATAYVEQHAKKFNKSWRQASRLIGRYAVPKLGSLAAASVTRSDIKNILAKMAPILANQVLASTSAVFSWAIREGIIEKNPCALIDRNPVNARERILSNAEVKSFWEAFDEAGPEGAALKLIALTAARPGEIGALRTEHVTDGVWVLPGAPDPKMNWPGTKNARTHSVPLSKPAQEIIDGLAEGQPFAALNLGQAMRQINAKLNIDDAARPHDLRRSALSMIAGEYGSTTSSE
jgi:integrase